MSMHGPTGWGRFGERAGRVGPRARVPPRTARDACNWRSAVQPAGCGSSDPGRSDPREAPRQPWWRQQVSQLGQEELQRRPASGPSSLVTVAIYRLRIGSTDSAATQFRKVKFMDRGVGHEWSGSQVEDRLRPILGWDAAKNELSHKWGEGEVREAVGDAAEQCRLPLPGAGGLGRPSRDAFIDSHTVLE